MWVKCNKCGEEVDHEANLMTCDQCVTELNQSIKRLVERNTLLEDKIRELQVKLSEVNNVNS